MLEKFIVLALCAFTDFVIIINMFNRITSRGKNKKLVGNRLFRFRGESVLGYILPLIAMTLTILNALSNIRHYRIQGSTDEILAYIIGVNDIASMYWPYAVSVAFILYFLIFTEFLYLMIFKSEVYEEGILRFDGKLITWGAIEGVEFKDSFFGVNKRAAFKLKKSTNLTQIIYIKNFEEVKNFIETRVKSNIK